MTKAVAVAIRKTEPVVARGNIIELGLAVANLETGELTNKMSWLIKPISFEAAMRMGKLSALMDSEQLGEENMDGIAMAVMQMGNHVNVVIESALTWWQKNVGTDKYADDRPLIVGFKPETTLAWLTHWFPDLGQLFGDSIDIYSAAWARQIVVPDMPSRVDPELTLVETLLTNLVKEPAWP